MFYNLSGDFRSPFVLFKNNSKLLFSNNFFLSQSASRPAWEVIYLYLCATVLVLLQTCLSLGGGEGGCGGCTCGVRLSCSVFTVLLSVSLVVRALSIALRLQVYKRREHHDM